MHACQITSAHSRYDIRIFRKESRSLAKSGFKVSLIVADGLIDEYLDGVQIIGLPKEGGRFGRMVKSSYKAYKRALSLNADVYHFHDPELLPYAFLLSMRGKKVVFDAHEDFPKQLRSKYYLNKEAGVLLSWFFGWFEAFVCKRLAGVIAATPAITEKFKKINPNSENINNYPMQGELSSGQVDWNQKKPWVAYIGGISSQRGIEEVTRAMEQVPQDIRLKLAGRFGRQETEMSCKAMEGWKNVDTLGFIDRAHVKRILECSIAGVVTFHPLPNHIDAQPNKMFEYMSAGIPVVGSDFELWRQVIDGNQCGICVDPLKPEQIAAAIKYLHDHPNEARDMGIRGQIAVQQKYNWDKEEKKLIKFYEKIQEKTVS